MKKLSLFSVSLLLVSLVYLSGSAAQAQVFQKGTKLVDAGIEFTDAFDVEGNIVPVYGTFEAGVTDDIGVGGKIRYWSKYGITSVGVQALGSYHFNRLFKLENDKFDVFATLGIGINRFSVKDYDSETSLMITPVVGARYFFTESVGVNAKLGFDRYSFDLDNYTDAVFSIGVSFKF